jgi:hypothetical protein
MLIYVPFEEYKFKELYLVAILCLLVGTLVSSFFVVKYAWLSTDAVPTDSLVTKQRCMADLGLEFEPTDAVTGKTYELFCNICNVYVNDKTKHCGQCNRCCADFDHHCKWLNNCIGSKNYWYFRKLINSYMAFNIFNELSFVAVCVTDYRDFLKEEAYSLYIVIFV